jgi:hypothetical protein
VAGYASCGRFLEPVAPFPSWLFESSSLASHRRALGPSTLPLNVPEYRGTSLIRNRTLLGPYRRPLPRVLGESYGGGCFLMSEVALDPSAGDGDPFPFRSSPLPKAALEATQGQMDGFFSQLSYKFHPEEVASVGD